MFSITCRTCAAKLKVKNAAAIGQRLSCPKCGEMVEVKPPPGWTPSENPEISQSAVAEQSLAAGDFDDIDQIISGKSPVGSSSSEAKSKPSPPSAANPPASAPLKKTTSGRSTPERTTEKNPASKSLRERPPGELPPAGTPTISVSDKPLLTPRSDNFDLTQPREYLPSSNLPPPDWKKPGNSKARAIFVSGLLLIGFLGVVVAIITLLNQSDSTNGGKTVAQANPGASVTEASEKGKSDESVPVQLSDTSTEEKKQSETSEIKKEQESTPAESTSEKVTEGKVENGKQAGTMSLDQPAPGNDTGLSGNSQEMSAPKQPTQEKPGTESSVPLPSREERPVSPLASDSPSANNSQADSSGTKGDDGNNPAPSGPTTLTDRLGKLSQLLSGPGTTLTELGDLAQSERTDRLVGLPRYLISQPTPEPPIGDPWALPVTEIVYKDVPLHLFISEFSSLTGVPLSIDALALGQAGIATDSPISVELENTSTGDILAAVLQELKLERVNLSGVEVILPSGSQNTGTYQFPLPKIKDPSEEKFQAMTESLKKLVDPVSWSLDTGNRKITVEGKQLVVANTSTAAAQIGEFLEKLAAAEQLLTDQTDAGAAGQLKSRAVRSLVGLQKALQLEPTLDQPLEELLQRVYQQTGVAVSVDWAALGAAGWSNLSQVPGDFQADTVEQLLKELARSLSATWIAVDERTFQLTSFQEASRRGMLEVYPLQGLAIEPAPLMEILNQTLAMQLRENPAVQFLYVPEIHSLVVSAPQPLQRQFEAIVSRLKQPAK